MELNKNHIQFIDQYLLKIGIEFYDVRMELIDHIASTFEEDETYKDLEFSEAIRLYHLQNKKFLYSNSYTNFNGLHRLWHNRKEFASIFKQIFNPFFWLFFLVIGFTLKSGLLHIDIFTFLISFFVGLAVFQLFFQKVVLKRKFKSIEIRSYFLTFAFIIFNPLLQFVKSPLLAEIVQFAAVGMILIYTFSTLPLYITIYKKYRTIA